MRAACSHLRPPRCPRRPCPGPTPMCSRPRPPTSRTRTTRPEATSCRPAPPPSTPNRRSRPRSSEPRVSATNNHGARLRLLKHFAAVVTAPAEHQVKRAPVSSKRTQNCGPTDCRSLTLKSRRDNECILTREMVPSLCCSPDCAMITSQKTGIQAVAIPRFAGLVPGLFCFFGRGEGQNNRTTESDAKARFLKASRKGHSSTCSVFFNPNKTLRNVWTGWRFSLLRRSCHF